MKTLIVVVVILIIGGSLIVMLRHEAEAPTSRDVQDVETIIISH